MTPKLTKAYETAKKDKQFCEEMEIANDCFVPSWYSEEEYKIAFAVMYMGWVLKSIGTVEYNKVF